MRSTQSLSRIAFGTLLFMVSLNAAAATCNLTRDTAGFLRGVCNLSYYLPKTLATFVYVPKESPFAANLTPHGMHYFVTGNTVDVAVEVDNTGNVRARAPIADVVVQVWQGQTKVAEHIFPAIRMNDIAAGGSLTTRIGQIVLSDLNNDNDLIALISVDTPSAARPLGEISERDETDNTATKNCRVYGLVNPNTSVRRCN